MSEPARPPAGLAEDTVARTASEAGGAAEAVPATAPPSPPGGTLGRAGAFRRADAKRKGARHERYADVILAVVLVLGAYLIVTTPPNSLLSDNGVGTPGPPVRVNFGSVSVSTVPCSSGGSAYAERIPWTNSSRPVTTGDIDLEVYAIFNGDNIGRGDPVAVVTSSNVCAGSPPDPVALWYVVLQAPNGTNLLTYTVASSWTSVAAGPSNVGIQNASSLVLVSNSSLAGSGRGLKIIGFLGEAQIEGAVVL